MAVVQTLDPIYVDVTQSSKEILSLKKDIAAGKLKTKGGAIPVTLIMEDGTKYPQTGELTLSEVSVDPGTGTITLRAEFPNPRIFFFRVCSSVPSCLRARWKKLCWFRSVP